MSKAAESPQDASFLEMVAMIEEAKDDPLLLLDFFKVMAFEVCCRALRLESARDEAIATAERAMEENERLRWALTPSRENLIALRGHVVVCPEHYACRREEPWAGEVDVDDRTMSRILCAIHRRAGLHL